MGLLNKGPGCLMGLPERLCNMENANINGKINAFNIGAVSVMTEDSGRFYFLSNMNGFC